MGATKSGRYHATRRLARRAVTVHLDANFDARVRREAEAHGMSVAEAVRVYLDAGIAAAEAKLDKRANIARAFSSLLGDSVDDVEV